MFKSINQKVLKSTTMYVLKKEYFIKSHEQFLELYIKKVSSYVYYVFIQIGSHFCKKYHADSMIHEPLPAVKLYNTTI